MSEACPCGSSKAYEECCGPYISGQAEAPTAEALMRSRYSAYAKVELGYLRRTLAAKGREGFDEAAARKWAAGSKWLGLSILSTEEGAAADREGSVTFVARYVQDGKEHEHRELASFAREEGRWRFVDGKAPSVAPAVRDPAKVGRNDPCSCGSGKKHKKCCGA